MAKKEENKTTVSSIDRKIGKLKYLIKKLEAKK